MSSLLLWNVQCHSRRAHSNILTGNHIHSCNDCMLSGSDASAVSSSSLGDHHVCMPQLAECCIHPILTVSLLEHYSASSVCCFLLNISDITNVQRKQHTLTDKFLWLSAGSVGVKPVRCGLWPNQRTPNCISTACMQGCLASTCNL